MFDPPQPLVRLLCGAAMGVAAAFFIAFLLSTGASCKIDETYGVCFREWLSALSGWAAATGAVLAIIPLTAQLREMRRQTAYIIGDEEPQVELTPANRAFDGGTFRVINWNRKAITLTTIKVCGDDTPLSIYSLALAAKTARVIDFQIRPRLRVRGFEDKSREPYSGEFKFFEYVDNDKVRTRKDFTWAKIELGGYIESVPSKPFLVYASVNLDELFE